MIGTFLAQIGAEPCLAQLMAMPPCPTDKDCNLAGPYGRRPDGPGGHTTRRTILMNPISRFIYWNMNYHVEHRIFPMVPYHALPRLHVLIKHDLPAPNRSTADGFAEKWPALVRQMYYQDYFVRRDLPSTANPYRDDLHMAALGDAVPAE